MDYWDTQYYYDRRGRPITMEQAARLLSDFDYRKVAQEAVGSYWVSTVWLGMNHEFGDGPPLIFETMIFGENLPLHQTCWRWSTEQQAQTGHLEIVTMVRYELELTEEKE